MEFNILSLSERHDMICELANLDIQNRPDLEEEWQKMAAWDDAYETYVTMTDSEVYTEYHKRVLKVS